VGTSRDPWQNLAAQLFGTWGSSERIHDLDIFRLPEEQALPLMSKYDVSYALVFTPDDLQKFNWIADIAGNNASEYLTVQNGVYQPTELGSHVMLYVFCSMTPYTHNISPNSSTTARAKYTALTIRNMYTRSLEVREILNLLKSKISHCNFNI